MWGSLFFCFVPRFVLWHPIPKQAQPALGGAFDRRRGRIKGECSGAAVDIPRSVQQAGNFGHRNPARSEDAAFTGRTKPTWNHIMI